MKKCFVLMSVLLICTLMLFAAGTKETEKTQLTLALWDENQKPAIQKIVDQYNASQDTAEVVIELTPWGSYWTKLDAAAGSKDAPDVFWMNTYLPKYVSGGVLEPLDDYIARDGIDMGKYVAATVKMHQYEGKTWGIPKGLDSVAVALNKELFERYGVPLPQAEWTWDEMISLSTQLRDKIKEASGDEYPILMELDAQPSHFNFVHQTGGYVINEDFTKSGYNLPETTLAYQRVVDLMDNELLAPYIVLSDTNGTDLFLSGKGAILFVGSWKGQVLENSTLGKKGSIQLITMPRQEAGNYSVLGGLSYVISAYSKHKDAAWDFVKFITGEVGNTIQAQEGIDIPAYKSAQQEYLENFENINVDTFFQAAEMAVPFPAGPDFTLWIGFVNDYVAQIFGGQITAEEGTQAIYKEMQAILDS
ncbi:MAG: ABC transporter substrate-binding protein [Sphaerochaetaceae bacterium]